MKVTNRNIYMFYLCRTHCHTMNGKVSIHARIARVDKKILERAVKEGRALNESDAIRVAIRMLGESLRFTEKVRAL